MAILKKRTSSRQLPKARGIERAPLSSVIGGTSNRPAPVGTRPSIAAPSTTKPSITTSTASAPKQTLTSATKPDTTTSATKPATTKPSITTPTPATKTAIKPGSTKPNATVNAITNAISGAALGAGTKLIVDKLKDKFDKSKDKSPKTASKPVAPISPAPKAPPTSVITPPVNTKPVYETPLAPGGGAPYDDAGNLMPGWQLDENNNPVWIGVDEVQSKVSALNPNEVSALTPEAPFEPQYFDDGQGNIYVSTADGGYDLYRTADAPEDDSQTYTDPDSGDIYVLQDGEWVFETAGNQDNSLDYADDEAQTYTDPDSGAVWTQALDGSWNTDYVEPYDPFINDEEPLLEERSGGLINMMKNGGGIQGYATGGKTQFYDDGSYITTYDDGSQETVDSDGHTVLPTYVRPKGTFLTSRQIPTPEQWPSGYVSNGDGTATTIFDDGSTMTVDEDMNPVDSSEATPETASAGGSNWLDSLGNLSKGALNSITGALGTTAGAAGAGALVATLLGSDFGGGTQNEGLDMSKVGVINPRTTNFGIGPTNLVGYDQYGADAGEYTPNAELLKNLNAPGYNPVNEGDYGYEDAPVQEKASGGLSSMSSPVASYYTFGQPADIMANLGMRPQPPMNPPEMMTQVGQQQPAQQAQQQGLSQQMPQQMAQQTPQGMPQQGMMPQQQGMPPPMRKGGLSHVSNVPMVEGRMDFRNGSAVHGPGDGQSDDIPAMLADGEYVIDAETVAQIGNGSTKAGAQALDRFREGIRAHKRSAPLNKIPPKTKALTSYLKGAR